MNVTAIGTEKVLKPAGRIATMVLGTGLFLSSCAVKSPGLNNDSFQKENTEVVVSDSAEKKPIIGELLFGTALLGCVAWALLSKNKATKE